MSELVASTDGVRVALHDLGGRGPNLLILHATGFHGRCYQQIANKLGGYFHVWAPDLRGHGDSKTPDMDLPWSGARDDVLAVIDHLGGEPVFGFGHSMGGAAIVSAELDQPGTIRAAWLFEPIIFPSSHDIATSRPSPLATAARKRRRSFDSTDSAIDSYTGRGLFADWDPAVLRDYVNFGFRPTAGGVTLKATPENEGRTFDGVDLTIFERLTELSTPMTVASSTDGHPPARIAPKISKQIPEARLEIWGNNTHMGPFENPSLAARGIRKAFSLGAG